ncbi:hypothetical protein CXY01_39040 [Cellulomonas xylanilytica]|uniref:Uncharacterized protein n=2 Tax=Cellulomonas xylanilytica TaxID=233583 RepID=A0A510V930_9CELL|nr:hypothetical protein CXY01_39040 [Cellulomonas xylanilytica]
MLGRRGAPGPTVGSARVAPAKVATMTDENPAASSRYTVLPERVPLADTIASVETDAAPDPLMGRDTETEFMLRNAG